MENKEFWDFISSHIKEEPTALRLKYAGRTADFDIPLAILQIECRKKYAGKLAKTLEAFPRFIFPTALSGEQCSSDKLASWHASLITEGTTVADLTAGLGIDAMHIAARASSVTALERNPELAEALNYNSKGLAVDNLKCICADCRELVRKWAEEDKHFDYIFMDPARRGAQGERIFDLKDCEPSVPEMFTELRKICKVLIIKTSPMLDMSAMTQALPIRPVSVTALGTPTECKELVVIIDMNNEPEESEFKAVTLSDDSVKEFSFTRAEEVETPFPTPDTELKPGYFIYEPYPAVMKAGGMKILAHRYGLQGFAPNTRLLFSTEKKEDFPGKTLEVIAVYPYASSVIKRFSRTYPQAQVAVRNFDIPAEELRRRLGVREGQKAVRVFGIKDFRNRPLLVVTKQN